MPLHAVVVQRRPSPCLDPELQQLLVVTLEPSECAVAAHGRADAAPNQIIHLPPSMISLLQSTNY